MQQPCYTLWGNRGGIVPSFAPITLVDSQSTVHDMATSQPLTPEEFERVLRIKTDANQLFGAGESQRALDGWTAALQVYDGRLGSPEQRFEKGRPLYL